MTSAPHAAARLGARPALLWTLCALIIALGLPALAVAEGMATDPAGGETQQPATEDQPAPDLPGTTSPAGTDSAVTSDHPLPPAPADPPATHPAPASDPPPLAPAPFEPAPAVAGPPPDPGDPTPVPVPDPPPPASPQPTHDAIVPPPADPPSLPPLVPDPAPRPAAGATATSGTGAGGGSVAATTTGTGAGASAGASTGSAATTTTGTGSGTTADTDTPARAASPDAARAVASSSEPAPAPRAVPATPSIDITTTEAVAAPPLKPERVARAPRGTPERAALVAEVIARHRSVERIRSDDNPFFYGLATLGRVAVEPPPTMPPSQDPSAVASLADTETQAVAGAASPLNPLQATATSSGGPLTTGTLLDRLVSYVIPGAGPPKMMTLAILVLLAILLVRFTWPRPRTMLLALVPVAVSRTAGHRAVSLRPG